MSKAIYALSGDPVTFGHINIIERASDAFDELIVGIGCNPAKKYMFTLEERLRLATNAVKHLDNVTVTAFSGLLVDFAFEQGADIIVKGVRDATDFAYEFNLHQVGDTQGMDIDTHILFTDPKMGHISSSTVKGVQLEHGDISNYVPLEVKAALEQRVSNQFIIGVTGQIAAGKSTLCDELSNSVSLDPDEIGITNIDMDALGHEILGGEEPTPSDITAREEIIKRFGEQVKGDGGTIDRKLLAPMVFGNTNAMEELNKILAKPLKLKLRRALHGVEGIVLLNSALIVEGSNMLKLCNNRVIVVTVDEEEQLRRLTEVRGHSREDAEARIRSQLPAHEKIEKINKRIEDDSYGFVHLFNSQTDSVDLLYEKLLDYLP